MEFGTAMRSALLALLLLPGGGTAQEAGEEEGIPVLVTPRSREEVLETFDAYPEGENFEAVAYARLALDAAGVRAMEADWQKAHTTLRRAVREMKRHAPGAHLALATLHNAAAAAALRKGEMIERNAHFENVVSALRAAYGATHPETAAAELQLATSVYETAVSLPRGGRNYLTRAMRLARETRKRMAEAHGEDHPAALFAELVLASYELNSLWPEKGEQRMRAVVVRAARRAPELAQAGRLALARHYKAGGQQEALAAVMVELAADPPAAENPIQISEVDDPALRQEAGGDRDKLARMLENLEADSGFTQSTWWRTSRLAGNWAEVAFCVDGQGLVQDVRLLDGKGQKSWIDSVIEAAKGWTYLPGPAGECRQMVERVTVAAETMQHPSGSRIPRPNIFSYTVKDNLFSGFFRESYLDE